MGRMAWGGGGGVVKDTGGEISADLEGEFNGGETTAEDLKAGVEAGKTEEDGFRPDDKARAFGWAVKLDPS